MKIFIHNLFQDLSQRYGGKTPCNKYISFGTNKSFLRFSAQYDWKKNMKVNWPDSYDSRLLIFTKSKEQLETNIYTPPHLKQMSSRECCQSDSAAVRR